MAVYGGFAGTETSLAVRDWLAEVSDILFFGAITSSDPGWAGLRPEVIQRVRYGLVTSKYCDPGKIGYIRVWKSNEKRLL